MLSHEGLPPERETLEYAWQMEILLGKISARLTMIQVYSHEINFLLKLSINFLFLLKDRKIT